jgi:hypothetical protein
MDLKLYLLIMLMMSSDDVFKDTTVILEYQSYLHRSDITRGDRFDRAVSVIQLCEKMEGLEALKKALERAIKIERKQENNPAL